MAGKVVEDKPKVCKHCEKPGFQGKDGKMQHERRGDPGVYGGRRTDPNAAAPKDDKKVQEQEPDRSHVLHRRLWGKSAEAGKRQ